MHINVFRVTMNKRDKSTRSVFRTLEPFKLNTILKREDIRVDSDKKLAWTCENKHTIHCGFPTYFSTGGKCPICEIEKSGEIPSLDYWARITNNKDILNMYETASDNQDEASKISYKTSKKVWFRDMDTGEEVMEALNEITVNGKKPPFKNKVKVNLKH